MLVSHYLDEVLAVADTVTVMRDGARRPHRRRPPARRRQTLVAAMIGRDVDLELPRQGGRSPPTRRSCSRCAACAAGAASTDVSLRRPRGRDRRARRARRQRPHRGRAPASSAPTGSTRARSCSTASRSRSAAPARRGRATGSRCVPESRKDAGPPPAALRSARTSTLADARRVTRAPAVVARRAERRAARRARRAPRRPRRPSHRGAGRHALRRQPAEGAVRASGCAHAARC